MLLKSKLILAVLLCVSSITAYACSATITNNSNKPWTFDFEADRVVSTDCTSEHCVIPAHSTVNILYLIYETSGGYVSIADSNGSRQNFEYMVTYSLAPSGCSMYTLHQGNTGAVSMNQPKSGSFTIEKDTW